MNMFDKQSLIQRIKDLPFPEKEYWVVSGGAMVLHEFRSQTRDTGDMVAALLQSCQYPACR